MMHGQGRAFLIITKLRTRLPLILIFRWSILAQLVSWARLALTAGSTRISGSDSVAHYWLV
jgi:hypothetical protein